MTKLLEQVLHQVIFKRLQYVEKAFNPCFVSLDRAYSRPFGCHYRTQSSALSFEKNIFSKIVKNNICLGGASKQNALFSENVPPKNAPLPPMPRIGPVRTPKLFPGSTPVVSAIHDKTFFLNLTFLEILLLTFS